MPSKGIGATVSAIVAAFLLGFAGTAGAQPEPEPADEIAF